MDCARSGVRSARACRSTTRSCSDWYWIMSATSRGASPAGYHVVNVLLPAPRQRAAGVGVAACVWCLALGGSGRRRTVRRASGAGRVGSVGDRAQEHAVRAVPTYRVFSRICDIARPDAGGRTALQSWHLRRRCSARPKRRRCRYVLALAEWVLQSMRRLRPLGVGAVAARLVPMVLLAGAAGALTAQIERQVAPAWVELPTLMQRVVIAANAPWFYAANFLLPVRTGAHLSQVAGNRDESAVVGRAGGLGDRHSRRACVATAYRCALCALWGSPSSSLRWRRLSDYSRSRT